jgi:hypothetical protein
LSNFFNNLHPLIKRKKATGIYDDDNYAVLNALDTSLSEIEQETIKSKVQSSLLQATGDFLDKWGSWFGVFRKNKETDEDYRQRIINKILLKRGTLGAIIDAIIDYLDDEEANVTIYEPFRNIFYLNKSKLNGEDYLMGYHYRFAVIDITIDKPFPPEIYQIVQAFKPAGVQFYISYEGATRPITGWYAHSIVTERRTLEISNGLYKDLRGNLNLTNRVSADTDSDLFITNESLLNGEDVLAGSFSHGKANVNLVNLTTLDYKPEKAVLLSGVEEALGAYLNHETSYKPANPVVEGQSPVAQSLDEFYMYTGETSNTVAQINSLANTTEYVYTTFDVGTMITQTYARAYNALLSSMTEEEAINTLFSNFKVYSKLRLLSVPTFSLPVEMQVYDFTTSEWQPLAKGEINYKGMTFSSAMNRVYDYLSDNKLLQVRFVVTGITTNTVLLFDVISLLFSYVTNDLYAYNLIMSATAEPVLDIPIENLAISEKDFSLITNKEATKQLTAVITPSHNTADNTLTWTSSDAKVATVSETGLVTAIGNGSATITVTTADKKFSATVKITNTTAVTDLTIVADLIVNKSVDEVAMNNTAPVTDFDANVLVNTQGEATVSISENNGLNTYSVAVTPTMGGADVAITETKETY